MTYLHELHRSPPMSPSTTFDNISRYECPGSILLDPRPRPDTIMIDMQTKHVPLKDWDQTADIAVLIGVPPALSTAAYALALR
jgi:hypothetical protein